MFVVQRSAVRVLCGWCECPVSCCCVLLHSSRYRTSRGNSSSPLKYETHTRLEKRIYLLPQDIPLLYYASPMSINSFRRPTSRNDLTREDKQAGRQGGRGWTPFLAGATHHHMQQCRRMKAASRPCLLCSQGQPDRKMDKLGERSFSAQVLGILSATTNCFTRERRRTKDWPFLLKYYTCSIDVLGSDVLLVILSVLVSTSHPHPHHFRDPRLPRGAFFSSKGGRRVPEQVQQKGKRGARNYFLSTVGGGTLPPLPLRVSNIKK